MRLLMIATLLLAGCIPLKVLQPKPSMEWLWTCTQAENINPEWSCENIDEPTVVVSAIIKDHVGSLLGGFIRGLYYPGEKYIFIREGMPAAMQWTVTVHEMAHYLLHYYGVNEMCETEEYARFIAGQDPDEWRARYGCKKDD